MLPAQVALRCFVLTISHKHWSFALDPFDIEGRVHRHFDVGSVEIDWKTWVGILQVCWISERITEERALQTDLINVEAWVGSKRGVVHEILHFESVRFYQPGTQTHPGIAVGLRGGVEVLRWLRTVRRVRQVLVNKVGIAA